MGRDMQKTTEFSVDYAYGLRKLCNGNLRYFYDTFINPGQITVAEFYNALRYMERITPKVDQELEEAILAHSLALV